MVTLSKDLLRPDSLNWVTTKLTDDTEEYTNCKLAGYTCPAAGRIRLVGRDLSRVIGPDDAGLVGG